jgi:hypothetical protein
MSKILENITESLKKSPHLLVIFLIVGGFLLYLVRHDNMELQKVQMTDRVSEQRISRCHSIQQDSAKIMENLNNTLINHDKAFTHLLFKLDRFIEVSENNNRKTDALSNKMEALSGKMKLLELSMDDHEKPHQEVKKILESIVKELSNISEKLDKK